MLGEGKLAVIDNQIDTTTGTIKLKATFANDDLRLWPGQFVNARLLLTMRKDSAVVPASVVQRGPEGAFAFVIKEDQTVEMRPVKVAPDRRRRGVDRGGPQTRRARRGGWPIQAAARFARETRGVAGHAAVPKRASVQPDERTGARASPADSGKPSREHLRAIHPAARSPRRC